VTTTTTDDFAERYGPWALIAGASEGVGLAYSRAMAERGLNVALVSRRQDPLDELAAELQEVHAVMTRVVPLDLSEDSAAGTLMDAVADLDVGMFLYCAGADPLFTDFLDASLADADGLVRRNCLTPMRLCHHLAGPMVHRGRGGIVLVSSGAALVGARRMVAYAASKAFDMVMAEALWAELHGAGVDVLGLVLGVTDTPALRRLLAERGNLASADDGTPIPGAASPEEVVADALAHLAHGPTWFVGDLLRDGAKHLGSMDRSDAAHLMLDVGAGVMDQKLS
jgi:short-subunit dehydrogenase